MTGTRRSSARPRIESSRTRRAAAQEGEDSSCQTRMRARRPPSFVSRSVLSRLSAGRPGAGDAGAAASERSDSDRVPSVHRGRRCPAWTQAQGAQGRALLPGKDLPVVDARGQGLALDRFLVEGAHAGWRGLCLELADSGRHAVDAGVVDYRRDAGSGQGRQGFGQGGSGVGAGQQGEGDPQACERAMIPPLGAGIGGRVRRSNSRWHVQHPSSRRSQGRISASTRPTSIASSSTSGGRTRPSVLPISASGWIG